MLKKVILTFFNAPTPAQVRVRLRQVRRLRARFAGGASLPRFGSLFFNSLLKEPDGGTKLHTRAPPAGTGHDKGEPMQDSDVMVIRGVREDGRKFRPSDWIERISATLATFGSDGRLSYSRAAQPCIVDGEKCLVVQRGLAVTDPRAYEFIMEFARSNGLCIIEDRRRENRPVAHDRRRR